jgi:hypothetical protein
MYCYSQEAHGLDAEVILACTTHVLGGTKGLILFGNGLNMKAVAFSINDSPKELIHWRFNKWINRLIALKPSGEILYMRCTIYWCSRMIAYFDKVYSFISHRYVTISYLLLLFFSQFLLRCAVGAGDMDLFCRTCYVKMTNALFFGWP